MTYDPMLDLLSLLDRPDDAMWYEFACGVAHDVIDKHREVLLPRLLVTLPNLNANMQEHLAYLLCDGPGTLEHDILVELATSANERVAWRANEALDFYR